MTEDVPAETASRLVQARVGLAGAQMKRLATTGGFAIDESTGNELIAALEGVLQTLEARWATLQRFRDNPALSDTATGQWVSAHMVATAADEQGLLTQLEQARAEFPSYIEAIRQAKRNYQSREEETRVQLTAIPPVERN